jgi:regulator of sigma E protease
MITTILSFLVLLIILIFVHELGHFLAAKLLGVRVETFSLGFPPKMVSRKLGETVYQIGWIPVGGYVKLFGEGPDEEIGPEEIPRSFSHKPVWAKSVIVLAGPFFNIVFAIFALWMLAWASGIQHAGTTLGPLDPESPLARAGAALGDVVVSVDGAPVSYYEQLLEAEEASGGREMALGVTRGGSQRVIRVVPERSEETSILGDKESRWRVGFVPRNVPILGKVASGMPAQKAGLLAGDLVTHVDGVPTPDWIDVVRGIQARGRQEAAGARDEAAGAAAGSRAGDGAGDGLAAEGGAAAPEDAPGARDAVAAGSRAGDGAGGPKDAAAAGDGSGGGAEEGGAPIMFRVVRGGETLDIPVVPDLDPVQGLDGETVFTPVVGISLTPQVIKEPVGPVRALGIGLSDTWGMTKITVLTVVRLLQNKISAKLVGGPLMIADLAGKTAKIGLASFILLMALISINLAILNLLPLPILDGGQFLIFLIEGAKRGPISLRVREIAQWVGIGAMAALFVLVFINDISRLVTKLSGPPAQVERRAD